MNSCRGEHRLGQHAMIFVDQFKEAQSIGFERIYRIFTWLDSRIIMTLCFASRPITTYDFKVIGSRRVKIARAEKLIC